MADLAEIRSMIEAALPGAEVEVIDFGPESAWDLGRIEERLAADKDGRIKAVLAVHVDTSSSVRTSASRSGGRGLRSRETSRAISETGSAAASSGTCTTACSPAWFRWR